MTEQLKATIEVSIAPRQGAVGAWNVEAIDEDGSIEQAIFAGPNAERRARSYAELQYTRAPVQSDDADYLRKLALGHSPGVARRLERIAARLTRPSPEADAVADRDKWRSLAAGLHGQFDWQGCTCTFPSDECCAFAAYEAFALANTPAQAERS